MNPLVISGFGKSPACPYAISPGWRVMESSVLLVTPAEAAKMLSLARSTLYQLLTAGEIESIKVGGCRRIPTDALISYVARLREEQRA